MDASTLHGLIARVCPIDGVSVGDPEDKSSWAVSPAAGATDDQKAAAATLLGTLSAASIFLPPLAQTALDVSDVTALRCVKAGVAFPSDWRTYVVALRAIVNGSDTSSAELPTRPAWPEGT